MNNKSATIFIVFFGLILLVCLLMLQTCDGPPSAELPGSFRLVIKASCPIAKDEQEFMTNIKQLSTTFSAGNSSEKFFIPNVSLVRIDKISPTSSDSAAFDIPSGLVHYFKSTLVQGTQFRDLREDEEKSYFMDPNSDSHFSDFQSKALRAHAEDVSVNVPNCLDSNEYIMCNGDCDNPSDCPNKYWKDIASLKKHLEKRFGTQPPSGEIVIYYLCGTGKTSESEKTVKDTDGDSVPDEKDDCPTIAGKPVHLGCPDRDNDGVKDEWDRCPDEAGEASNNGCPKGTPPPPPPGPIVIKAELSKEWLKEPTQPNNTIIVSIKNDVLAEVSELRWQAIPKPRANKREYSKCSIIPGLKKSGIKSTNEIVLSTAEASCANCPYEIEIIAYDKNGKRLDKINSAIVNVERIKCHSGN